MQKVSQIVVVGYTCFLLSSAGEADGIAKANAPGTLAKASGMMKGSMPIPSSMGAVAKGAPPLGAGPPVMPATSSGLPMAVFRILSILNVFRIRKSGLFEPKT